LLDAFKKDVIDAARAEINEHMTAETDQDTAKEMRKLYPKMMAELDRIAAFCLLHSKMDAKTKEQVLEAMAEVLHNKITAESTVIGDKMDHEKRYLSAEGALAGKGMLRPGLAQAEMIKLTENSGGCKGPGRHLCDCQRVSGPDGSYARDGQERSQDASPCCPALLA
jgi:hypothetical protein